MPVRTFADILDVAFKTVSHYRKRGEADGYLVLVKEHEGRRKATEYRFNLDALRPQDRPKPEGAGDWGEIE